MPTSGRPAFRACCAEDSAGPRPSLTGVDLRTIVNPSVPGGQTGSCRVVVVGCVVVVVGTSVVVGRRSTSSEVGIVIVDGVVRRLDRDPGGRREHGNGRLGGARGAARPPRRRRSPPARRSPPPRARREEGQERGPEPDGRLARPHDRPRVALAGQRRRAAGRTRGSTPGAARTVRRNAGSGARSTGASGVGPRRAAARVGGVVTGAPRGRSGPGLDHGLVERVGRGSVLRRRGRVAAERAEVDVRRQGLAAVGARDDRRRRRRGPPAVGAEVHARRRAGRRTCSGRRAGRCARSPRPRGASRARACAARARGPRRCALMRRSVLPVVATDHLDREPAHVAHLDLALARQRHALALEPDGIAARAAGGPGSTISTTSTTSSPGSGPPR